MNLWWKSSPVSEHEWSMDKLRLSRCYIQWERRNVASKALYPRTLCANQEPDLQGWEWSGTIYCKITNWPAFSFKWPRAERLKSFKLMLRLQYVSFLSSPAINISCAYSIVHEGVIVAILQTQVHSLTVWITIWQYLSRWSWPSIRNRSLTMNIVR